MSLSDPNLGDFGSWINIYTFYGVILTKTIYLLTK